MDRGVLDLFLPVEDAFAQRVNVSDHQNRNKAEHAPEDYRTLFYEISKNNRPRVHKYDLQVEEDEKHRNQIKLHRETGLRFTLRHHAAFVRRILRAVTRANLAKNDANSER